MWYLNVFNDQIHVNVNVNVLCKMSKIVLLSKFIDKSISWSLKRPQKQSKQRRPMFLDVNWSKRSSFLGLLLFRNTRGDWFYGSVAWKLKNSSRRDVRLNYVNWSVVATSLLGNSRYQTYRNNQILLHNAIEHTKNKQHTVEAWARRSARPIMIHFISSHKLSS